MITISDPIEIIIPDLILINLSQFSETNLSRIIEMSQIIRLQMIKFDNNFNKIAILNNDNMNNNLINYDIIRGGVDKASI